MDSKTCQNCIFCCPYFFYVSHQKRQKVVFQLENVGSKSVLRQKIHPNPLWLIFRALDFAIAKRLQNAFTNPSEILQKPFRDPFRNPSEALQKKPFWGSVAGNESLDNLGTHRSGQRALAGVHDAILKTDHAVSLVDGKLYIGGAPSLTERQSLTARYLKQGVLTPPRVSIEFFVRGLWHRGAIL